MYSQQEKQLNISLRLPDFVIERADDHAKELQLNRTEIIEKALQCFLGVRFDEECSNQSEIAKL